MSFGGSVRGRTCRGGASLWGLPTRPVPEGAGRRSGRANGPAWASRPARWYPPDRLSFLSVAELEPRRAEGVGAGGASLEPGPVASARRARRRRSLPVPARPATSHCPLLPESAARLGPVRWARAPTALPMRKGTCLDPKDRSAGCTLAASPQAPRDRRAQARRPSRPQAQLCDGQTRAAAGTLGQRGASRSRATPEARGVFRAARPAW